MHNVGRHVVEELVKQLAASWIPHGEFALVAQSRWKAQPICLVKLQAPMNDARPTLLRLARELNFTVRHCILVHDDVDLPAGTVRTRMRGGAAGHGGVQSVIQAFQMISFRGLKSEWDVHPTEPRCWTMRRHRCALSSLLSSPPAIARPRTGCCNSFDRRRRKDSAPPGSRVRTSCRRGPGAFGAFSATAFGSAPASACPDP